MTASRAYSGTWCQIDPARLLALLMGRIGYVTYLTKKAVRGTLSNLLANHLLIDVRTSKNFRPACQVGPSVTGNGLLAYPSHRQPVTLWVERRIQRV